MRGWMDGALHSLHSKTAPLSLMFRSGTRNQRKNICSFLHAGRKEGRQAGKQSGAGTWHGTAWPALQAPLTLNDDRVRQWSGGKKRWGRIMFFFSFSFFLHTHYPSLLYNTHFLLFFFAGHERVGSCNPTLVPPPTHSLTRTFPTLLRVPSSVILILVSLSNRILE